MPTDTYTPEAAKRLILNGQARGPINVSASLYLSGCTLPEGFTIGDVAGSLYLRGCTLPEGFTIGDVAGWLDLRGCTLPEGFTIGDVAGSLDLRGCTLPEGFTIGDVAGSLYLRGCTLPEGFTIGDVAGWLDLRGCKNISASMWWRENGEETRRHCIAVCPRDGYALIQTDADKFSAGCRTNLTRDQALSHWNRDDAQARLFSAAIQANRLGGSDQPEEGN